MTFSAVNIWRVWMVRHGIPLDPKRAWLPTYDSWPRVMQRGYLLLVHSYGQHATEFLLACAYYYILWPWVFPRARTLEMYWIAAVILFNLLCELSTYGFWHGALYVGSASRAALHKFKYNPTNQYEPDDSESVGWFTSSTGNLEREIALTTAGWLQGAAWQVLVMHAYARGGLQLPAEAFWERPLRALATIALYSWWRDLHFYVIHRLMHPWSNRGALGKPPAWDLGYTLYRNVHSLHHNSYNPGPWSGLAMHPVEHFIYFSCVLLPLLLHAHPLVFWYVMSHALVSPVGGHDGYDRPGGGGGAHYLHHAHCEVNYGVSTATPVDFDGLFGTSVSWDDYVAAGRIFSRAKQLSAARRNGGASAVAKLVSQWGDRQ